MGVGQRVIRGGAHVGGVVVIDGGERVRDVLLPVYEALELEWRPSTVGSVADEVGFVTLDDVRGAFIDAFARRHELKSGGAASSWVEEAHAYRSFHDPAASPRSSTRQASASKTLHVEDGEAEGE